MKRPRWVVAAASVAVLAALMSACSAPSTPSEPAITLTPAPSKTAQGTLPAGAEIDAWAAAVLPEDSLGGTSPAARVSGELSPDTEAVIDLAQPAGVWDLTIVCQSANGSPLSLSAAPVAKDELRPLDCSAPGGELGGAHLSITYDGGSAGTLTLRASAPAVYVYEISAHAAAQD